MSIALPQTLNKALEPFLIIVGSLTVSMVLFGVFVASAGTDPFEVYQTMYRAAFGTLFSWQNTLIRAAPLMLTALCTALPGYLGLIVIGGEGAVVMGGLFAAIAARDAYGTSYGRTPDYGACRHDRGRHLAHDSRIVAPLPRRQ